MKLANKTALVTGGNSGLGFEITKELIKAKCNVIILGKDSAKVEKTKTDVNSNLVTTLVCDLRNQSQIAKTIQDIKNIDILINCAGVIAYSPLPEHGAGNIKNIVETNLLGTIFTTQAVLPTMIARNTGIILNVSSTTGLPTGGHPNESVYAASKFGVSGFTDSLKKDIDEQKANIKVLGLYPGGMNTKLFSKSGLNKDTSEFMDPSEIAQIVIFMLERPDSIKMDHVVINRNKNL
jgi:uncharacterized protein